jgi:ribosomal protein S18 acetylase RimI-like enzyme
MSNPTRLEITITPIEHMSPAYLQAVALRQLLLRKPLGLSLSQHELHAEEDQLHLAAIAGETVVASLSVIWMDDHARIRQMAVDVEWQGSGIGRALLQAAEMIILSRSLHRVELHARVSAQRFYEKAGYHVTSNEYIEVTLPHRTMSKTLVEG